MTITFTAYNFAAAHFDVFYIVNDAKASDPVSFPNYKYIADVYVNGTMIARLKAFPDPIFNFGVFNVGHIIRGFLGATFQPTGGVLLAMELGQNTFNVDVQLKFGEEYGFTSTFNIVSDSVRKIYNYYVRLQQGDNAPLSGFIDKIPTNANKVNSYLSTFRATFTTDFLLVNYFPTTTTPVSVSITGNGTYSTTITPTAANNLLVLNIAPGAINTLRANTINNTLNFYTVTIGSETFRVNLFCEAINPVYHIHFLNQYGGFETAVFNKVSRQTTKVDRKDFGTNAYRVQFDGTLGYRSGAFTYNESNYTYAVTYNNAMVLNTDVLSDKEYIWLEDLIESPLVYLQMNGFFYPIKITNSDYEIRKQINETDLTNLTLNIDLGRVFNSQFR